MYLERNHIKNRKRDDFVGMNIFMCSVYRFDVVTNESSVIASERIVDFNAFVIKCY